MPPEEFWQAERWFLELSAAGGERMKCVIRQPLKFQGGGDSRHFPCSGSGCVQIPRLENQPGRGKTL
jgi:hypothetical protein